jgi:hypothetical protein
MLVISTNFFIGAFIALYASVASAIPTTAPGAPLKNFCGAMPWVRRECAPGTSPRAWVDICKHNPSDMRATGSPECPIGTYCENIIVSGKTRRMTCVPASKPGTTQPSIGSELLFGSSVLKQSAKGMSTTTARHELKITHDMLASVSAFVLSEFLFHISIVIGANRNAM